MHPAFSVILLTTLIGVGQGLFLALYTGQVYALMNLLPAQDSREFYALGSLLALIFLAAGLVASFFHLGRPLRSWRAISRWRSSWLSREVIILPLVMALIALYGLIHFYQWDSRFFILAGNYPVTLSLLVGLVTTVATFLLFITTAMIYASIKFLQSWHHPLTVINYLLLGGASGFSLTAAFSAYVGADLVGFYALWAVVLTLSAFLTQSISLWRNQRLKAKSTLQTAIGVRHTLIAQKAQGAMGGSFNTREFFHGRSTAFLNLMRTLFILLVFLLPILLLLMATVQILPLMTALTAFVIQYLGLMIERWYFFAQARHPQNLYYQAVA
ncbi:MAG: DmsC/YnfH family molybdoenzyme membrane anchor subunit [Pseudomonadota bacterium]|nr:DmsC/YnfH family molybdoenzyme membrane anchor subunit [Pseudomonadota bacterium]